MKRLFLTLCAAAALAVPMAFSATAQAGTYHMQIDTSQNIDGWKLSKPAGYWGCSFISRPGPCTDADVPVPTPLQVFAQGNVLAGDEAHWYWVAPPTVTIDSGSLNVTYTTTSDTRVFLKARLRNYAFVSQPELHVSRNDGSATWNIPTGNEVVGAFLSSSADHTFSNKWSNAIRVNSMDAVLRDDTAPLPQVTGDLASGRWLNDVQSVCATVAATDAGSGVVSSTLRDQHGMVYDQHTLPTLPVMQPGAANYSHDLCLVPSDMSDGRHDLEVIVTDAAGETSAVPLSVWTDSTAPTASVTSPTETTDRRTPVSFSVDPGPSGLASFQAWVDGQPMTVTGSAATYQPVTDLAFGSHTVTWSATDQAGNHRDGFWTFNVIDAVAPSLSGALPAADSSTELRRPQVEFVLTDDGSGIDPASLRVLLDGADVAPFGVLANGRFVYVPATDLGYGSHTVSVAVSDHFGNAMTPQRWSFTVADSTPPQLSDVRPDDGSAGSDRTPAVSVAVADAGIGVDPSSILMTLDGQDVTAGGAYVAGRFSYIPPQPLAYGRHDVTVLAADRSGNRSAPLSWSFQVRDETPPTVADRTPRPGATVVGPTAVTFTVADAGTGIDDATLLVTVDGQDVTGWSTFNAGRFVYDPGNLGSGVHTVAVTVADSSGNVAGPLVWQFAVVDPARLDLQPVNVPGHLVAGTTATLRFAATSNGAPLAATVLRVSSRAAGSSSFSVGRTLTTDASGEIAWQVRPLVTTDYRVELVDSGTISSVRTVVVAQRVRLAAASARVHRGSAIRLTGAVLPAHAAGRARVQLFTRRGWVTVATPHVDRRGGFGATLLPRVAGRYVFRVVVSATPSDAAGTSQTVTVQVV